MKQNRLLQRLRSGETLNGREQLLLIVELSIPAILAQISQVAMEYIDSSMVGSLGAEGSASIGLVASTTWLFGGVIAACSTGFTVQVAQYIGAGREKKARELVWQGLIVSLLFSFLVGGVGAAISGPLPRWLGGESAIAHDATWYFRIFAMAAPIMEMVYFAGGMIQCSGNMLVPSVLQIIMCALDVVFNAYWIFPSGTILPGFPGAGLGVPGAALGTVCAQSVAAAILLVFLFVKSPSLHVRSGERHRFHRRDLSAAARIAVPIGIEQSIQSGAQVVSTTIVAPLGTVSIAANSLAVTAEGLCYMPGYGIQSAATTLIGQSIGAGRKDLVRRLSWMTIIFGMVIQTFSGIFLYAAAPLMMHTLSADASVQALGVQVLRIEAFAEPWFAASIIANGVFRGAGDTLVPSIMGLVSMWAVRLPLAMYLTPSMGLPGVWTAMRTELTFRGVIFLIRVAGKKWMKNTVVEKNGEDALEDKASGKAG